MSTPGGKGVSPPRVPSGNYKCLKCGVVYKTQRGTFQISQSPIYLENNAHIPVCNNCIDELYSKYLSMLHDDAAAAERVCMKFDIYWNPDIWQSTNKLPPSGSRIRAYTMRCNLQKTVGKTYDNTILENKARSYGVSSIDEMVEIETSKDVSTDESAASYTPDKETILFWGGGFTPDFYYELNQRYDRWTKDLDKPLDIAVEALYKQICIQESTINRNIASGKSIEQGQKTLSDLLGALNAKPVQKKDDDDSSEVNETPLGVWGKIWEENRPIPDDEEMKDSASLVRYISVWFMGHLGKMLGMKNAYSKMYEDEMEKWRVQRPEFVEEDDNDLFDDIFGDVGDGDDIVKN